MTKRTSKKQQPRARLQAGFSIPLVQQILALVLMAAGAITLLALFDVTAGAWSETWVGILRMVVGWGAYPVAAGIVIAGFVWLQHHLERPIQWRWRPFVGAELVFFSLLGLTHLFSGSRDMWSLVESGLGGGLVGWGVSIVFSTYLGRPAAIFILLIVVLVGMGLAFDATASGLKRSVVALRERLARWRAGRGAARQSGRTPRSTRTARDVPLQVSPGPKPPSEGRRPPARVSSREGGVQERPAPPGSTRRGSPTSGPGSHTKVPPRAAPHAVPSAQSEVQGADPFAGRVFQLPSLDMFARASDPAMSDEEIRSKSRTIEHTLAQFGLPAEVTEVRVGPTVAQFGVTPGFIERSGTHGRRVRVGQISALADDLALALAAPRLRVEAPVPGRPVVGIEVPNSRVQMVGVREVMGSDRFRALKSPLGFALGRDVAGEPVVADLAKMPHLLIAGTTGSGKSVCIKAITVCLICNNAPSDLRLIMIDPKMVELVRFNGLPHLYGRAEVDLERVVKVLRWVAQEMDQRYKLFADATARHIDDYNDLRSREGEPALPRIVVMIDELADLMMLAPDEVERTICRIAQMARATGIHLVVATQRPSVDVVTGLIKANFPARISFATASATDSRVILDMTGADALVGRGDMLYLAADAGHPVRVQGCWVSEEELERVVRFWRDQVGPVREDVPWEQLVRPAELGQDPEDGDSGELLEQAVALVRATGSASASLLQRRLSIGHPRAARLMKQMEEMGVIGPPEAAGRRRRVIIGDGD